MDGERWIQGFGEGRSPLDLGVDGWVILQWMLKNRMGDGVLDCSGSGWRQVAGCCECGNELGHGFGKMRGISCLAEDLLGSQGPYFLVFSSYVGK
jgi:hypothetical protein